MMRTTTRLLRTLCVAVATGLCLGGAASAAAETLTVYTAVEAEDLKKYAQRFNEDHPDIEIKWVRDSTGIVTAKLLAEKDNPQADVIWGLAATSLLLMKSQGMLLPYAPKGLDKLDPKFRDKADPPAWTGMDAWVAAVCVNTFEQKKHGFATPRSWKDLTKPEYKGHVAMPNPNSSGTGFLDVSSWLQMFGEDEGWKFMDALHENISHYTHSGSKPCKQAASGEVPIGVSFAFRAAKSKEQGAPLVLKASGLAAGKGAIVCMNRREIEDGLSQLLSGDQFDQAAEEIVVEAFMEGEEASLFVVADGTSWVMLPTAQDHKRIGDDDTGPNTGGMGAYAPAPVMTPDMMDLATERIVQPTLDGLAAEGMPYNGVLYVGLMITPDGPKVVEYNCRFGDPEAQAILPLVTSDALELLLATAEERLSEIDVAVSNMASACVVMASGGYPGSYSKGLPVSGLDMAAQLPNTLVFHAGTVGVGSVVRTSGGRVLAVSAQASGLQGALARAYTGISLIHFDGAYHRTDIGKKGLLHDMSLAAAPRTGSTRPSE